MEAERGDDSRAHFLKPLTFYCKNDGYWVKSLG